MATAHLYVNDIEIDTRLSAFDATREELINIVREVVGARADAVDDDPITAAGLFAYIHGTRHTRALFRSKGWRHERKENIEAVRHFESNLKIIYQSVDVACDEKHIPQAISGKGSGAERAIDLAQGSLFPDGELDAVTFQPVTAPPVGVWFFCVSVNGEDVRAELSKAAGVSNGNFRQFEERIFIIRKGEWENVRVKEDVEPDGVEFVPVVRRK
jgi:hypothetical protein